MLKAVSFFSIALVCSIPTGISVAQNQTIEQLREAGETDDARLRGSRDECGRLAAKARP